MEDRVQSGLRINSVPENIRKLDESTMLDSRIVAYKETMAKLVMATYKANIENRITYMKSALNEMAPKLKGLKGKELLQAYANYNATVGAIEEAQRCLFELPK